MHKQFSNCEVIIQSLLPKKIRKKMSSFVSNISSQAQLYNLQITAKSTSI